MKLKTLCGLFGAALGLAFYAPASAQTVLDKVYTEQQAQRGADEYQAHCAMCHEGDEPDAPSPKGPVFIERWREAPLDFLYTHISKNMPGNAPGSLKEDQYLDVLAYLLRENRYPAGATELTASKLGSILLVGPDGPQPLPAGALVRVVGCLASGSPGDWTVTSATPLARVREVDQTSPKELAQSSATPSGGNTYRLRNTDDFHVDALKGQRVQVKGVLGGKGNALTVSAQSMERVDGSCGK